MILGFIALMFSVGFAIFEILFEIAIRLIGLILHLIDKFFEEYGEDIAFKALEAGDSVADKLGDLKDATQKRKEAYQKRDGFFIKREKKLKKKEMRQLANMAAERAAWDIAFIRSVQGQEQRRKDEAYLRKTDNICRIFLPILVAPVGIRWWFAPLISFNDGTDNDLSDDNRRTGGITRYGLRLPLLIASIGMTGVVAGIADEGFSGLRTYSSDILSFLSICVGIIITISIMTAIFDIFILKITRMTHKADIIRRFPCEEGYTVPAYTKEHLDAACVRLNADDYIQPVEDKLWASDYNPLRYTATRPERAKYDNLMEYGKYGEKGYFGSVKDSDIIPDVPVTITETEYELLELKNPDKILSTKTETVKYPWTIFTKEVTVDAMDRSMMTILESEKYKNGEVSYQIDVYREYHARRLLIRKHQDEARKFSDSFNGFRNTVNNSQ